MKIGFLITARLKSTRFPLKILKDLKGKTVIERIIDRTKYIKDLTKIILCTSVNQQDRLLVEIAQRNGVDYFIGDEDDVLKRLLDAAKSFELDYVLNITADNPLFSIEYANLIVEVFNKNIFDFVKISGLPLGCGPYGLKTKALELVCAIKNVSDTEIWPQFFNYPDIFTVKIIEACGKMKRPNLRLTLDYEKDYELINNIYSSISFEDILDLSSVFDYLDRNPHIARINQECIQKKVDLEIKTKTNSLFLSQRDTILKLKEKMYQRKNQT